MPWPDYSNHTVEQLKMRLGEADVELREKQAEIEELRGLYARKTRLADIKKELDLAGLEALITKMDVLATEIATVKDDMVIVKDRLPEKAVTPKA